MASDGSSFLPRIQSVFYAVFDLKQGPKICYQVPEGLIAVPSAGLSSSVSGVFPFASSTQQFSPPYELENTPPSAQESSSYFVSPTSQRPTSRGVHSPHKRSVSSNRILFNFDDISKYVIPPSALCGRLVKCTTRNHRIIGFPVELRGDYERNYFRYNLCFVFGRKADLSCYEPIVRKVSRVLTACEEESAFLSSSQTSPAVHAILEQLYEDLNSYSETSIPIDKFNSIELKIFPFYPNPPDVSDWMVPLALINLTKRIEANWDLTMVKVCRHVDGTNHVSRIAHLADCDLDLTRQAISHLLFYQVIMMIDIFQFSNMYTLRKSIQWLADEAHVRDECGPYVTKPGRAISDWPKLLRLYSRFKPGKTVLEWMKDHDVAALGIDVRRFASFGVIKGFLRRVHRWPILLPGDESVGSRRGKSFSTSNISFTPPESTPVQPEQTPGWGSRDLLPEAAQILPSGSANRGNALNDAGRPIARKSSVAETVLERLRKMDMQKNGSSASHSPHILPSIDQPQDSHSEPRRQSFVTPPSVSLFSGSRSSSTTSRIKHAPLSPILARPRLSRSPSAPILHQVPAPAIASPSGLAKPYPSDLLLMLDGEHHTDELAVRFEAGWPLMEQWLAAVGGGNGVDDLGRVFIIYR